MRRTPLRMRRSQTGASSIGSASSSSTAWANSRSEHRGLERRVGERAGDVERQLALRRAPTGGPSRARRAAAWRGRNASSLVVSPPASAAVFAPAFFSAPLAAASAFSQLAGCRLRALAHERLHEPLVGVHVLVGEAALVAQPAVVDLVVVAREHAHHALVADGQLDVALRGAERADGAGALDVPRARAEAVRARGERADRAQLDDVAAERRDVRVPVEGADERVRAALEQDQLVVLGDLLREAHAAVAEDAALAVDRDQRRELERLLEVALGLDEARGAGAPAVGDVLQRALAALVADRAVERVVDEQELDHRALRLVHALRLRVDDHAVLDRRRARGLQLRDALDLDQAHAARADRLAELGLVTEDRDLDVAVLGRVDQHRVAGRLDLEAVDGEGHHLHVGTRHG